MKNKQHKGISLQAAALRICSLKGDYEKTLVPVIKVAGKGSK